MKLSPFYLAVCKDRPDDPDRYYHSVYFINNTGRYLKRLHIQSSSYVLKDGKLITKTPHEMSFSYIEHFSYLFLESLDDGTFEFFTSYQVIYQTEDGKKSFLTFELPKNLLKNHKHERIPVLEKPGYLIKM